MKLVRGRKYRIMCKTPFFKEKYGTEHPTIVIEGKWKDVGTKSWGMCDGNPACILFAFRMAKERIALSELTDDRVYYGHVEVKNGGSLGELVLDTELEEVK